MEEIAASQAIAEMDRFLGIDPEHEIDLVELGLMQRRRQLLNTIVTGPDLQVKPSGSVLHDSLIHPQHRLAHGESAN